MFRLPFGKHIVDARSLLVPVLGGINRRKGLTGYIVDIIVEIGGRQTRCIGTGNDTRRLQIGNDAVDIREGMLCGLLRFVRRRICLPGSAFQPTEDNRARRYQVNRFAPCMQRTVPFP